MLADGAVHEAQVLERVNLKFHEVRILVVFSSSGYSFQVELRDSRGIIGHSSVQRLEKNKCCDCPGYNNNMRDVKSGPIQSLFQHIYTALSSYGHFHHLEQQKLPVSVQSVEGLEPAVLCQRVGDLHDVVLGGRVA